MHLKLHIKDFGRQLVATGDLDPVYIALNKSGWDVDRKLRWLVVYCAFYHCGVATYISEYKSTQFWRLMADAAKNIKPAPIGGLWPRARERRHFRGDQALKALNCWYTRYPEPERMFLYIMGKRGSPFQEVLNRALQHRSVGSWLSFKLVDLVDACLGAEVDQSDVVSFFYSTPRDSAIRVWNEDIVNKPIHVTTNMVMVEFVVRGLLHTFKELTNPHKLGQPLDVFCIETILCKHASHLSGHYPLYNDIREIHGALAPWLEMAESISVFKQAMPKFPEKV